MSTPALLTMLLAQGTVTFFTIYFLIKVLRSPTPSEETENP